MTTAGITFFQVISLILTIISIVVIVIAIKNNKRLHYATVPILLLLLHEFLFYSILLTTKAGIEVIPGIRFTTWSSIMRWHSTVTIFTIIMAKIFYSKALKLR